MTFKKALWSASGVFGPDYPRQSSSVNTIQANRYDRSDFCRALESAIENEMPGYYSVYSFPRGHSRDQNIPKVNCIFIDLDVEGNNYDPKSGQTDFDSWRRDMSALLTRVRMIVKEIIEADQGKYFRAVLSGHKGLHLYLDFPTIAESNGSFEQFKVGLKEYGEQVMSWLNTTAGGVSINRWVDVDASDLGRLARHPNTIHHNAAYDDVTRWCVPVTIEELAELRVDDYLELTQEPRWPDGYERTPSETAGDKVSQKIRTASVIESRQDFTRNEYDPAAIGEYKDEVNENLEVEDIPFLTSNKPCIDAFVNRNDAFNHGNASHTMEIAILTRLVEMKVSREVIHEYFQEIPHYDEGWTDEQIDKIIARGYSEFNCRKIAREAPGFCFGSDCAVYRRNDDIQK